MLRSDAHGRTLYTDALLHHVGTDDNNHGVRRVELARTTSRMFSSIVFNVFNMQALTVTVTVTVMTARDGMPAQHSGQALTSAVLLLSRRRKESTGQVRTKAIFTMCRP